MSKPKQIRVLLLLLVLAPLTYLLFLEHDPSPDWTRTKVVVIYPQNADDDFIVDDWLSGLDENMFREIEDYITTEATRYDLELDRPIEIRLAEPITGAPTAPPTGHGNTIERLRWAARLRWWHLRFSRANPEADSIIIAHYQGTNTLLRRLHSVGMAQPRLALVNLIASDSHRRYNNLQLAHEILHTFGASDLYHYSSGQPDYPEGYASPEATPRYPQQKAEIMAMRIPTAPNQSNPAFTLDQTTIGPQTAREIGW